MRQDNSAAQREFLHPVGKREIAAGLFSKRSQN
jgi:hypothetical protein